MKQSIVTKYLGPTNTRGSRIKATAIAGSLTTSYQYELGIVENHEAAALALCKKFGWDTTGLQCGGMPKGGYVFTFPSIEK